MDSRQQRSAATRIALMRAAEQLIARKGIGNVSIREIVTAAGQKNESALQYHFKHLNGLIQAIHSARDEEVQARRMLLLADLSKRNSAPSLREICKLMVQPTFSLAQSRPDFRAYVKAFGHEITLTDQPAMKLAAHKGGQSVVETRALLRAALNHLDDHAYQRRMDGALRFIAASMYHQARQPSGFRGARGHVFFHSLIDALVGLLNAPESDETRAASAAIDR